MEYSCIDFKTYEHSVADALDSIDAGIELAKQEKILLKPNIINNSPHPITTPPEMCEAVIKYIRKYSDSEIIIGDGCGQPGCETIKAFKNLGYSYLEDEYNVKLIDLNYSETKLYTNNKCKIHKELYLPTLIETHYIISLPVLKAHSLAEITGAMKNMMGLLPPEHYSGRFGSWKKAVFHRHLHQSIIDLNMHVPPKLSIMDATIGMAEYHLGGAYCNPPANKIIASYDAKSLDRKAAELLGFNWKKIGHLK